MQDQYVMYNIFLTIFVPIYQGVDPNRNWGYHWGESGVSNDKCSDIYPGPEAFSEVEMQNIKAFVESLEPTPILGKLFCKLSQ